MSVRALEGRLRRLEAARPLRPGPGDELDLSQVSTPALLRLRDVLRARHDAGFPPEDEITAPEAWAAVAGEPDAVLLSLWLAFGGDQSVCPAEIRALSAGK